MSSVGLLLAAVTFPAVGVTLILVNFVGSLPGAGGAPSYLALMGGLILIIGGVGALAIWASLRSSARGSDADPPHRGASDFG